MTTIIEKDSPTVPLLVLGLVCLIFLGGVLGLAYMGGVFTGKNEEITNDKGIATQSLPISVCVVYDMDSNGKVSSVSNTYCLAGVKSSINVNGSTTTTDGPLVMMSSHLQEKPASTQQRVTTLSEEK